MFELYSNECVCRQVHGVALLQGVQEGGEMNAPPPPEERQQFEEGFHWPRHLKIPKKSFGSFSFSVCFFFLFFFDLARCGGETTHPTTRGDQPAHLSST